jgi:Uma2 family endonuclease
LIGGNLFASLKSHLKGSPCRAFTESVKVQVARNAIFYPDVFVTCDAADLKTEMVFHRPLLIIEVLSPSTEAFDRSLKFTAYRQIETLREYVLVDPETRSVEVFRRNERGLFELHDQTAAAQLHLDSVDLHLAMAEVFDGIDDAASGGATAPP